MTNWAMNLLVAVTFLTLVSLLGHAGTFWLYGLVAIGAWIFFYRLVPETKGKSLEQIEAHWRSGKSPRQLLPDQPGGSAGKPEDKPEAKTEAKPDVKDEAKPEAKPETKAADAKPEAKAEQTPDAKTEPKPEVKAAPKSEVDAKTPTDLTPQIATRAYELYEQQGRQDGESVQNWDKAEREVREDQAKAEAKPETKVKTPSDLTPQLVKRVHGLYEDLGRQEVRAVEELEKAQRDNRKDEPDGPQK